VATKKFGVGSGWLHVRNGGGVAYACLARCRWHVLLFVKLQCVAVCWCITGDEFLKLCKLWQRLHKTVPWCSVSACTEGCHDLIQVQPWCLSMVWKLSLACLVMFCKDGQVSAV
jgi:hypothetical protein